jgi:pimeloyl-ACP methyl ester carboxylesterase
MPATSRIAVRDTPVDLRRDGNGPPLLYLHGAGAGGRWLAFEERLAERFDVLAPTHPGHGGSPPAEWIEHISDLAFHYLDLLDTLGLVRVHVVGASFGGWIAAEMATMASGRLQSMTLSIRSASRSRGGSTRSCSAWSCPSSWRRSSTTRSRPWRWRRPT